MIKNLHGKILKGEPKEQHLSTVSKSCSKKYILNQHSLIFSYIFFVICVIWEWIWWTTVIIQMAICSKLKRIGFVEAVVTMTIYLKRKRKRIICVANGQTNLLMKKMGLMEKIILGFHYDFQLLCPSKAIFYLLILC